MNYTAIIENIWKIYQALTLLTTDLQILVGIEKIEQDLESSSSFGFAKVFLWPSPRNK